jgi:hypothetical protein
MRPTASLVLACVACSAVLAGACTTSEARFSEANARAHVDMLAGIIGNRPTGTDANRHAREYLIDQLRLFGFDVRVQNADAVRPEVGRTVRVANIIATKAGARPEAIALVAHYDSPPESPGAADDGLGVAVCLEAGRVLAARPHAAYTLVVALTDAEELGLMGAAAVVKDPIFKQVRTYLNFEAIGSAGPSFLFQEGPDNPWLAQVWARQAPHPAGGSWIEEIYRRLPNDTDFTILARTGTPGLNFAPVRDSYTYHTPRDVPDRLPGGTILQTGLNTVAIMEALDREDITQRSVGLASSFDVAGMTALAFGPRVNLALSGLALAVGILAWVRLLVVAARRSHLASLVIASAWAAFAVAMMSAAMVAATWALREVREVYHPWYAYPDRFLALLVAAAFFGIWIVRRVRLALPHGARGDGDPASVWAIVMPAWITLAAAAVLIVPASSSLATIPLLAAAVALLAVPARSARAVRVASAAVFAVAATMWIGPAFDLFHFAVPALGRAPFVTPVYVYPALMLAFACYLGPPAMAIVAGHRHRRWVRRTWTAVLLLALAITAVLAYVAPAYTVERPLRRSARYIEDLAGARAYFEIASSEPGLDLEHAVAGIESWQVARDQAPVSFPLGPQTAAFRFRARTTTMAPAPADVKATIRNEGGDTAVEIAVVPRIPGIGVTFALPRGLVPIEPNLAGQVRGGRWLATYVAPPPGGVTFTARFENAQAEAIAGTQVLVTAAGLPGGEGWQGLPGWLHQRLAVWTARSVFIVPAFGR